MKIKEAFYSKILVTIMVERKEKLEQLKEERKQL